MFSEFKKFHKVKNIITDVLLSNKIMVFSYLVVTIFFGIEMSIKPYILKEIVNSFAHSNDKLHHCFLLSFLYALAGLLVFITNHFHMELLVNVYPRIQYSILQRLISSVFKTPFENLSKEHSGSISSRITIVTDGVVDIIKHLFSSIFGNLISIIVALVTFFYAGQIHAFVALVWIVIYVLFFSSIISNIDRFSSLVTKSNYLFGKNLQDILLNLVSIKIFRMEAKEKDRICSHFLRKVSKNKNLEHYMNKVIMGQSLFSFALQIVSVFILVKLQRQEDPGKYVLILTLNNALSICVRNFTNNLQRFINAVSSVNEALKNIDIRAHIEPSFVSSLSTIRKPIKCIKIKNIFFQYNYNSKAIYIRNLLIKKNEKIAVIGKSGSGKSTFAKLLSGFLEPKKGKIIFDNNCENKKYDQILYIPQNCSLFSRSLLENITYGSAAYDIIDIKNALENAEILHVIESLPKKYHTQIIENGANFSGGEQQRIMLARLFLNKKPVMVLDELTNELDNITEGKVLKQLIKSSDILIYITHRLTNLELFDRVILFDNGTIIDANYDGTIQSKK